MTARVLVVDDIVANVKLLEAKLTAEYFDVLTAMSGPEALEIVQRAAPDIILLDVMMPGMDGFEVCRRLKASAHSHHIPVVMITALDQPSDRVQGLDAGADDFLTKPVSDLALFARVKSLVRLKLLTDELRSRAATGERMGLLDEAMASPSTHEPTGKILLVEDNANSIERITTALSSLHDLTVSRDPDTATIQAAEQDFDLLVVSLSLAEADPLRLCSHVRSLKRTRHLPILIIAETHDNTRLLRGLELGVNDYLMRPIDKNELKARVRTQLRRKHYADQLRSSVDHSMELAVTDPLTGLYNRRYMESHLGTLIRTMAHRGKSLSLMTFDIDFFKSVNDRYGHDVGDAVLKEFARRLKASIRDLDMACRVGGEEFVMVLPETDMAEAFRVAERLRQAIAGVWFDVGDEAGSLQVTVSIGIAALETVDDCAEKLLKRADMALYRAKRDGRNRVVSEAA